MDFDLGRAREAVGQNTNAIRVLWRNGTLKPGQAVAMGRHTRRWGTTPAAGFAASAERRPQDPAVIDDDGIVTFAELHGASNALARALRDRGVGAGASVAMLCRNTRWFPIAATGILKSGATTLYLNTGFAGPQVAEVVEREGADAVVYDTEFADIVEPNAGDRLLIVAHDGPASDTAVRLEDLIAETSHVDVEPPPSMGRQIILTSGTTGTPKGASRPAPKGLVASTALMSMIPWRVGMKVAVPAPMFHALGNGAYLIGAAMGHTFVLQRRFDAEATVAAIAEHRAEGMVAVPVMLQRMLDLPDEVVARYDTSSLQVVECSGAALPGSTALRWMDRFGDNLYNMLGSTEVGNATIATPEDLRAAPGTAGRPPPGVVLKLFDDHGREVPPGETGRIFVGTGLEYEGYTSGSEAKEVIDGLTSMGDVGWLDDAGRLFVGGRDDDMIVSGGENVFPREVEDLLADHDAVREVAVVGVEDEQFGQRLAAYVVMEEGAELSVDDVRAHVKANLANYKVPRDVTFLSELPRNASGKVLKQQLGG